MAFDFPSPATTGQQFTPAGGPTYIWNGYAWVVRGAGGPPADAFVATLSADQTGVVASTWTKVNFNTAGYNQNGKFSTSTSRWTPSAGPVQIEAQLLYSAGTTPTVVVGIYKNGVLFKQSAVYLTGQPYTSIAVVDVASGTDYYECWGFVTNAGTCLANPLQTYFQGFAIAPQGPTGPPGSTTPPDCGRLILGAASPSSTLKFTPYKGDQIKINGTIYPISAAGITSPSTGVYVNGVSGQNLAVSTVYWIYLFNNAGTLTFDFCTTTHTTSLTAGNVGVEIKSADDTRSLIGLIYTTSSGNLFVDDPTSRTVRSWFNRPRTNFARVASGWGGSSTSWASTGFAAYFLTFADDVIDITHHGYIIDNVASALCGLAIGIDSLSPLGQPSQGHNGGANYYVPLSTRYTTSGLSENVIHTINPLYTVNAGSATGYTDLAGTIG